MIYFVFCIRYQVIDYYVTFADGSWIRPNAPVMIPFQVLCYMSLDTYLMDIQCV